MVIEPAKTEYVDWAIDYNNKVTDPKKKIKIFMPGCSRYAKKNFSPEYFNPNSKSFSSFAFKIAKLGACLPKNIFALALK